MLSTQDLESDPEYLLALEHVSTDLIVGYLTTTAAIRVLERDFGFTNPRAVKYVKRLMN